MKRLVVVMVAILVVLVSVLSGCPSQEETGATLLLVGHTPIHMESGNQGINIYVRNSSSQVATVATVTLTFYNTDDVVISTNSDSTTNLEPGRMWKFQVECLSSEPIARYDIQTSVTS